MIAQTYQLQILRLHIDMSNFSNQKLRLTSPSLLFVFVMGLELMYASCISNTRIEKESLFKYSVFLDTLFYILVHTLLTYLDIHTKESQRVHRILQKQ